MIGFPLISPRGGALLASSVDFAGIVFGRGMFFLELGLIDFVDTRRRKAGGRERRILYDLEGCEQV